jgi:hypothetical protein
MGGTIIATARGTRSAPEAGTLLLGSPRSLRLHSIVAWAVIASLAGAGRVTAQPPATIPPPHSWTMLDLARSIPSLSGQRGAGAPCDTGATIALDRFRAAEGNVRAACLPNPAYETRRWCDLLSSPAPELPVQVRPEGWGPLDNEPDAGNLRGPASDPLGSSRQIVRALERAEARETQGNPAVLARFDIVDTLLLQEIRAHGAEAETWLLSARLRRLRQVRTWVSDTSGGSGGEILQPAFAAIEEALKVSPDDAMAHVWRAVLYDTRLPRFVDGRWEVAPLDRERALASLRRAVSLAPADPGYATLLARWLAESDDFAGARAALRACRAADHQLVAIVEDLDRLPRLHELGFHTLDDYSLTDWRWRLGDALRRLGRDVDHLDLRLRGWSWPDSAGAAEDALQRGWPGFRLFRVTGAATGSDVRLYAQRVASPQTDAAPATKRSSVVQDLSGGMGLILIEHPAPSGGRACCTLVVVDWRTPY